MKRLFFLIALMSCLGVSLPASAATGKVIKVLPHFLDAEGHHTVSPSLYDRDAFQNLLRNNPQRRGGMRFDIHWKTKGAAYAPLTLVLEVRGIAAGNLPKQLVLETKAEGGRNLFGKWTGIVLSPANYKNIGEVTAWRVSLWEGDEFLGEQKSFLW